MANRPFVNCKRIRFWQPRIGKILVTSKEQLHAIIDQEFPGLKRKPDFSNLLADAELHLALVQTLQNRQYLQWGEITRLAVENNTHLQKVAAYMREGWRPRLYYAIERSLSKTEAEARIAQICTENRAVSSPNDVEQRLSAYYPIDELAKLPRHKHRLSQVHKYFNALKLFKDGVTTRDIAKILNTSIRQVGRWYNGRKPALVTLAYQIPEEDPGLGYKWLPTKMESGRPFQPVGFIRVPVAPQDWKQIAEMLQQIEELTNEDMLRWRLQFDKIRKEESFAYVLGMLTSDGCKDHKTITSTKATLTLSKVHHWSKNIGEAFCFYLGKIGVKANRARLRNPGVYYWKSEHSPLLKWMIFCGLGLESHERTSYDPIKANWLLSAPHEIRLKFLQGLTDGDGCAMICKQVFSIASGVNSRFVKEIIETFEIEARKYLSGRRARVDIRKIKSIIRATKLPFFLHATGRQKNAEKITEMLRVRRKTFWKTVPRIIVERMVELREHGMSYGRIAERIYDEYNLFYRGTRVCAIIKRNNEQG